MNAEVSCGLIRHSLELGLQGVELNRHVAIYTQVHAKATRPLSHIGSLAGFVLSFATTYEA
jgi:hypothetical protein